MALRGKRTTTLRMDVKARTANVKPPAAPHRDEGPRDLVFAGAAGVAILALGAAVGLIGVRAAVILAPAFALVLLLRRFVSYKATGAGADLPDIDEIARLNRYSALLDSLPQPVMLLDGEDRIDVANAAARRLFGAGVEGASMTAVIRAPRALEVLSEVRQDRQPREAEFVLTARDNLNALFYAAPLDPQNDAPDADMLVMVRDRTEQKKLERMRTDFIANVSHELRTPLASILGFIETLQGHAREDPDARERFLKIMQAQTERMLRLVQDLVSLSALELNERRLPQDKVDLCEVAETVAEMMTPVARGHGGVLTSELGVRAAPITGDRDQLVQVMQNLIDNALKYGGDAGEGPSRVRVCVGRGAGLAFEGAHKSGDSPEQVAVRADCRPEDLIYVRVRDEGEGIALTDLPRLTERFYRIDVERSRSKGGTGLGLAIVKHIVGRHRGGILVESSEGEGAAFTCYFPPHATTDIETTG